MKVYIGKNSENQALSHHIYREGDQVVQDQRDADVCIPEAVAILPEWVGGLYQFQEGPIAFYTTMIFNGETFAEQHLLGIPITGLMNRGLGAQVSVGSVLCYVHPGGKLERLQRSGDLRKVLKDLRYTGTVSWCFDRTCGLVKIVLGLPSYGIYSLMQGRSQSIASFFMEPLMLRESWSVSLLLSRFPFPLLEETEHYQVDRISDDMAKYLWLFQNDRTSFENGTLSTDQTRIAIMTAWSTGGLYIATGRVLMTADHFRLQEKQYRTDISAVVVRTMRPLLETQTIVLVAASCPPWPVDGRTAGEDLVDVTSLLKSV